MTKNGLFLFMLVFVGFMIVETNLVVESDATEGTVVGETVRKVFGLHVVPDVCDHFVREIETN